MRGGVLLCGGTSTRFDGGDKVLSPLGDRPMVRHVADRLGSLLDELAVSCRAEQQSPLEDALGDASLPIRFAFDGSPDAGPLLGIGRGLAAISSEYAVVVAGDMPFVDPAFVEYLFERAAGHDAAVPRTDDGWYQPLQAVYRTSAMVDAVKRARREGLDRPIEAVELLDHVVVEGEELESEGRDWSLFNVNTREDVTRAERRLESTTTRDRR